jgi:hypothetical protein
MMPGRSISTTIYQQPWTEQPHLQLTELESVDKIGLKKPEFVETERKNAASWWYWVTLVSTSNLNVKIKHAYLNGF